MAKRVYLTKRGEKQYEYLKNKGIKLTRREFKDYYDSVRKANKKLGSKAFKESSLKANLYTLSVKRFKDRSDFLNARRNAKNVLKRDYKKTLNAKMREQLYKNIRRDLGAKNSIVIIEALKKMSDKELIQFFKVNNDIESLLYDSDNPISEYINLTVEQFETRLESTNYSVEALEAIELAKERVLDKEIVEREQRRRRRSRKRKV